MFFVLYRTSDGVILQTMMAQEVLVARTAQVMGCSYLEVFEQRDDYDSKFRVVDGELTPISAE